MTGYRRMFLFVGTGKCLQWTRSTTRSIAAAFVWNSQTIFTSGRRAVHHVNQRGPDSLSRRTAALTGGLFFKGGQQGWRKRVSPSIDFLHLHLPVSHASGGPGAAIDWEATLVFLPFLPPDFLNELLSVSRPLSRLRTRSFCSEFHVGGGGGINVLMMLTAGGVAVVLTLKWILV